MPRLSAAPVLALLALLTFGATAQQPATPAIHAKSSKRLVIRNAMIIYGNANWTTGANWIGDAAPVAGDTLIFPDSAAQKTNTNDFAAGRRFRLACRVRRGTRLSVGGSASRPAPRRTDRARRPRDGAFNSGDGVQSITSPSASARAFRPFPPART